MRKGKAGTTTADYVYVYEPNTSRLNKITQSGSNIVDYTYNTLGQITKQDEGTSKVFQITYTTSGLVKDVRNSSGQCMQRYTYDDRGFSKASRLRCQYADQNYVLREGYGWQYRCSL